MAKKILFLLFVILTFFGFNTHFLFSDEGETYYIFVMEGCPHCAKVESFINTSGINKKFNIKILDITKSSSNAELFRTMCNERAAECGGVPTLIYKDKVISGDTPIIEYFQSLGYKGIDWNKWIVIGLVGGAGFFIVGIIVLSIIKK